MTGPDGVTVSMEPCMQFPHQPRRFQPPDRSRPALCASHPWRSGAYTSPRSSGSSCSACRGRARAGRRLVFRPHGRGDGGLPPLLRAPRLQDLALVPVPARARARRARRRRACSGGRATTAGITRTRTRPEDVHSPRAAGFLVLAHRLDHAARMGRDRAQRWCATWRGIPELRFLDRPGAVTSADGRARARVSVARRRARPGVGLLRLHGAALARIVLDQLAGAPLRQAPLRHDG